MVGIGVQAGQKFHVQAVLEIPKLHAGDPGHHRVRLRLRQDQPLYLVAQGGFGRAEPVEMTRRFDMDDQILQRVNPAQRIGARGFGNAVALLSR